ncbi:MAG: SBBP repeat-containing protein, partial [candidate division FCPU426 bacterium]
LNSAGTALLYSTYLGGTGDDVASHIALDSSGNACVTGFTEGNFPTTSGAYQTVYGGGTHDVFLTKLNSAGTALLYSTYLGGSGDDLGGDIAVDSTGQVYLIGTASAGFPTTSGVYQIAFSGLVDAFVAKFDMAATAPTSTVTLTPTNTPTISPSFTVSATWSESPTFSPTPTPSATRTSTPTASETKTFTDSPTPSATKTGTGTGTDTHTPSFTRSPTLTRTPTVTGTGTRTATPTVSPFGTSTNSPTITPTHSNTPSFTDSPTPSATKTDSPTATETRTFTPSPTFSQTFTITDTFTIGMTKTPFNENAEIKIKGVYPNPVGAQGAMLVIHTSFQAMATVRIYDLRGELVYKRSDLQIGMGADGQFFWEAKNRGGKPLAYGTYYMKVSAEGGGRSASDGRWISVLR